jgi:membrane protein
MSALKIPKRISVIWQQSTRNARKFDERTLGWPGLLIGAARQALLPGSAIKAAAIAYFALFSLFPIALLSISIASFTLAPVIGQQFIVQNLEFIAPALGELLGENFDEIILARGPVTVLALVTLVWSASTIFYTLTLTLNEIWRNKHFRPVWKRRGLSILIVLTVVGPSLFLASFATSMIANIRAWLPSEIYLIGGGFSFLLAIVFDIALFMVLYSLLPHGASSLKELIPGAVGAGLLWEFAKKGFMYFVSNYITLTNLVYGSMTAIIAFLAWAYLSGLIFLFGAFLNYLYHEQNQRQQESEIRQFYY